jgi:hypothetical protein
MKNVTKYLVVFFIIGLNACKKDEPVAAPSIIGKWRQTGYSLVPLPSGTTQAQLDAQVICSNTILYEFTNTSLIIVGSDCKGKKEDGQVNYGITNGIITLSSGKVYEVTITASLLTITGTETNGGITSTSKLIFTRQ